MRDKASCRTTPLPGEKTPVVTYLGAQREERQHGRCFLVSARSSRSSAKPSASPATTPASCSKSNRAFPETFVYGANDVRYKINVLKIEPVVAGALLTQRRHRPKLQ